MEKNVWLELEESAKNYDKVEENTLLQILHANANTEYGKNITLHKSSQFQILKRRCLLPNTKII